MAHLDEEKNREEEKVSLRHGRLVFRGHYTNVLEQKNFISKLILLLENLPSKIITLDYFSICILSGDLDINFHINGTKGWKEQGTQPSRAQHIRFLWLIFKATAQRAVNTPAQTPPRPGPLTDVDTIILLYLRKA